MSLRLSQKHGVNPSVEQCFYCMKDVGVILFGKMKANRRTGERDPEAPRQVCFGPNSEPCDECKGLMKQGVMLVSVDEEKSTDNENPWRTGNVAVVRDEAVERWEELFGRDMVEHILARRFSFISDPVWEMLGLPS